MHHMQRIKFKVVVLVEPRADEVIETQAGASRQRQGVDHELGDRFLLIRAGLVVENVDFAVSDLQDVNVTGDRLGDVERNVEAELGLHVSDIVRGENDRHFNGNGHGIGEKHKPLNFIVAAFVVGDGLEHQVGNSAGMVTLRLDLNSIEVERGLALRGAVTGFAGVLKEVMRAVLGHVGKVLPYRLERLVLAAPRDEVELAHVRTVHVDLLMVESGRADELVRRPFGSSLLAQAVVGGEVAIVVEPARERPRVQGEAEAAVDVLRRAFKGVALIEVAQAFEDDLERIRAPLPCPALGEARGAVVAKPTLKNLVLLVALTGAGDVRALAVDAALEVGADDWPPVGLFCWSTL